MLARPRPPLLTSSGNPIPSSVTRNVIAAGPAETSITTEWASACRATFDSASRNVASRSSASRAGDLHVDRTVEDDARLERQRAGGLAGDLENASAHGVRVGSGGLDVEDHRADVTHREVELLDRGLDPAARLVLADEPGGALQREPRREQSLDDGVVQVTRDALLILQAGQSIEVLARSALLDDDAGLGRELLQHLDVPRCELVRADRTGDRQGTDHGAGRTQRHEHRRTDRAESNLWLRDPAVA